ncbi:MAG: carboxypeptidase regulatory-like domain-containing protein [Gammaproteobacteria bacterium]
MKRTLVKGVLFPMCGGQARLLPAGALCLLLAGCIPLIPWQEAVIKPVPRAALAVYATRADGTPLADAAVYLQALDASRETRARRAARADTVDLIERQFQPRIQIVRSGGSVVFNNLDDVEHDIYSFSTVPALTLQLRPGQSRRVLAPNHPMVLTLGCKIHNAMLAYMVVTDATVFGTTDNNGFLRFDELPPGHYRVQLWYADPRSGARDELANEVTATVGREQLVRFTLK